MLHAMPYHVSLICLLFCMYLVIIWHVMTLSIVGLIILCMLHIGVDQILFTSPFVHDVLTHHTSIFWLCSNMILCLFWAVLRLFWAAMALSLVLCIAIV